MPYDKKSFLSGLAVERQLKGWATISGGTVAVWMNTGVYTHFFIDYFRPLSEMSLNLFRRSTVLISTSGVVMPTEIRQISESVYQVFAPLPQESIAGYPLKGLNVVQFSDLWLSYSDGIKVPTFSAYLTVDPLKWWTPGDLRDNDALYALRIGENQDNAVLTMTGDSVYTGDDSANLSPPRIRGGADSASIIYT